MSKLFHCFFLPELRNDCHYEINILQSEPTTCLYDPVNTRSWTSVWMFPPLECAVNVVCHLAHSKTTVIKIYVKYSYLRHKYTQQLPFSLNHFISIQRLLVATSRAVKTLFLQCSLHITLLITLKRPCLKSTTIFCLLYVIPQYVRIFLDTFIFNSLSNMPICLTIISFYPLPIVLAVWKFHKLLISGDNAILNRVQHARCRKQVVKYFFPPSKNFKKVRNVTLHTFYRFGIE